MEHGILFKTELVRKLSTKTETRRLVNPQPSSWLAPGEAPHPSAKVTRHGPGRWIWESKSRSHLSTAMLRHHYGEAGDRLWVREAWCFRPDDGGCSEILFRAEVTDEQAAAYKWRPGIHLLKSDARIWLRVIEVKPQALLNINDDGARREGFANREDFLCAWDYINPGSPSERNPWVWVIRFELDNASDLT